MKWILILIIIFCAGATIDWNLEVGDEGYEVMTDSSTIIYRAPLLQEKFDREVSIKAGIEIKKLTEIGQRYYDKQGRKYAYHLSGQRIEKEKIKTIDLLINTTEFKEIR